VINSTKLRLAAFPMEPIGTLLVGVSGGGENASGANAEARQERSLSFAPWRRG
jgi:hypothetical protein